MISSKRVAIAFFIFLSNLAEVSKYFFKLCSLANLIASSSSTWRSLSHLLPINNPTTFSFSSLYKSYQDYKSSNDILFVISYTNKTPSEFLKKFFVIALYLSCPDESRRIILYFLFLYLI